MNRNIIILVTLLIVVIVAGAIWFLRSNQPTPTGQGIPAVTLPDNSNGVPSQQDSQSKAAVQSAFRSGIAPYVTDNVRLQQTVIAGEYALQVWTSDTMGGQALLKYNPTQGRWTFVTAGGGEWSVAGLVEAGVSQDIATTLLAGVSH